MVRRLLATIYFDQPTGQLDEVAAAEVVALIEAQTPAGIQVEYSQSLVFSLDGLLGSERSLVWRSQPWCLQ